MSQNSIVSRASNIRDGKNPEFTAADFRALMPEFTVEVINDALLGNIVEMAHSIVKKARWHQMWKEGMRLFIAHKVYMHLKTTAVGSDPASIVSAAASKGIATSKSVGAVSITYDVSSLASDLEGWGDWKESVYGTQFASMAKLIGKGGMYVR